MSKQTLSPIPAAAGSAGINVTAIAARTLLSVMNTGIWRVEKMHKGETAAERARHGTDAVRAMVTLCNHPILSEIRAGDQRIYQTHKRLTLPTVQDGIRLVPSARQFEHSDAMKEYADWRAGKVQDFRPVYVTLRTEAPLKLNGLYDAEMWPSEDEVMRRFVFSTRYLPCPDSGAWGEWIAESAAAGAEDMRNRLREALTDIKNACMSDGKLYASNFANLGAILALVPDMDLTGELAALAVQMAPLATVNAAAIAKDNSARTSVASQAASILGILGGVK